MSEAVNEINIKRAKNGYIVSAYQDGEYQEFIFSRLSQAIRFVKENLNDTEA